ncbi:hypothetical protein H5410_048298 [Solanum commersonii]|uniref:Uncharacterized protein n=1 Tax=Solanum commersonii TaxID=4109 RepID=A0A9J5XLF0_SOLCO|nr:hypothetical protein H5410_048298 [Solanum commersonii]
MAEEEKEEEVRAFLNKLKTVDPSIYVYQRDVVLDLHLVKSRILDHSEALNYIVAPFQGMNVGNAKNMSLDDLEKITNNFSDKTEHATLYHGFMVDDQEVTVKT